MKIDDMVIVSVDDHVIEPPDMFEKHMPADLKDKAPKLLTDDSGNNYWVYEDRKVVSVGLNAVAGRPKEEYGCEPTSLAQMRKGTYDIDARIDDMNVNGLLGSICFGSFISFDGSFFNEAKDKKLTERVIQAYNDWHIDEWCGSYPGRFIPMAHIPMWDIDMTIAEVKRCLKKGCHSISFSDNPSVKGLPSIHNEYWEPLWKLCNDERIVINCHIGTGHSAPHSSMESPIEAWISSMPMSIAVSATDWLHLEALRRYPDLKVALSEGGIGWVPYMLERSDFTHAHHNAWTNEDLGGKLPSEIFREHFITCFIDDNFGIQNRHAVGIENICYECDYPHSDTVWPDVPEYLIKSFEGVPDDEIDLILHGNAMREYSYDPFSVLGGRENCTVGALRAQAKDVDTSPQSFASGGRPEGMEEKRVITSGDVVKMFMANHGTSADEEAA